MSYIPYVLLIGLHCYVRAKCVQMSRGEGKCSFLHSMCPVPKCQDNPSGNKKENFLHLVTFISAFGIKYISANIQSP